jgi:uncharacterized membrane protein YedE/YeeE
MEHQNTLIWEVTFWEFMLVTVVLAGGVWQGVREIAIYMVLLAAATRFIHFALFEGTLLSLHYYIVDLIVLLIAAGIGFTVTRRGQMERQYGFLKRAGLKHDGAA